MNATTVQGSLKTRFLSALRRSVPRGSMLHRLLHPVAQTLGVARPRPRIARFVEAFAAKRPDAFFIQIGSNDGDQQDPLRIAIERHGWRGILVEPVPYVFERLKANHGDHTQLILENVAIAEEDGSRTFYYLPEAAERKDLPRWYDAIGSFHREVVLKHAYRIPDIASRIAETEVPCLRFDSLCAKHGVSQLDLLHTDVEGYDWELMQTIDLTRWRPSVLIYEHHHQDEATRARCREHLAGHGYAFLSEGLDTLAIQRQHLDRALNRRFDRDQRALG